MNAITIKLLMIIVILLGAIAGMIAKTEPKESLVPLLEDIHKPVVNGIEITRQEFINQYCLGKTANETCLRVEKDIQLNSYKGKFAEGW